MSEFPQFMNARQVAEYLDLNEKKVYSLANDGVLPATKVTGKWLFNAQLSHFPPRPKWHWDIFFD